MGVAIKVENNIYFDINVIKNIVAKVVREKPGVVETKHLFSKSIKSNNNESKVINIHIDNNNIVHIDFAISINSPNLILEIPKKLQTQIYNHIKTYLDLESKINIRVVDVVL